jgi:hypothetical protein
MRVYTLMPSRFMRILRCSRKIGRSRRRRADVLIALTWLRALARLRFPSDIRPQFVPKGVGSLFTLTSPVRYYRCVVTIWHRRSFGPFQSLLNILIAQPCGLVANSTYRSPKGIRASGLQPSSTVSPLRTMMMTKHGLVRTQLQSTSRLFLELSSQSSVVLTNCESTMCGLTSTWMGTTPLRNMRCWTISKADLQRRHLTV